MKNKLFLLLFLLLSFSAFGQTCTLSVNLTSSDAAICSGNPVVLTATASAGTPGYTYLWSNGDTTQTINVNKAGTYSVIVTDSTPGCPPVTKSIILTSGTVPEAPLSTNVNTCPGTTVTLTASGSTGTYQWYDAATGGNFLGAGASFVTPAITGRKVFFVETTITGCTSMRTAVIVDLLTGPTVDGQTTCAGSSVTFTGQGASNYQWYDASGGNLLATGLTFTTPALLATTTYYAVGLTGGCASAPTAAVATITPIPAAPVAADASTCSGTAANLHATAPAGAIFNWYTTPTGTTSVISSPDYTTPVLTATTTYYVGIQLNGCISARTPVTVTVNPIPPPPVVTDVTSCSGSPAVLTASTPAGTFQWFATPTSTAILATGNTFTTPSLNTDAVYYVQVINNGCVGPRVAVNISVTPSPSAPTATGADVCISGSATLIAQSPGGSYQWYDAASGGTLVASGGSFTTPVLTATTTYYLQTTIGSCTSPRTPVTVTVSQIPAAPTSSGTTVCSGSVATLTASGTGSGYQWYDAASGGTLLAVTQSYVTPSLSANTTYYVQNINGSCISPRTAVLVNVTAAPTPPTASGTTICPGSSTSLTASAPTGTIKWYSAATGGTLLGTGASYTTPSLSTTTTYYVQATNGSCSSTRTPVTVAVHLSTIPFSYASGSYCTGGSNPVPVITDPGGIFTATPAGLVIDPVTGEVNAGASIPGNYTITYTLPCAVATTTLSLVINPGTGFSYNNSAYCQDGVNPTPLFTATGKPGVFSAPAGLVFVNTITGEINLAASTPGTYLVTNTISAGTGCTPSSSSFTITIDKKITVNAGPDQTVAINTPVQLAGAVSGGVTTGTWSGGAGTFSNASLLNAVYNPASGESGSVTLTLTSTDPGNACGPKSDNTVITFNAAPAAPTALGVAICTGSVATLSATAPGGTYTWYANSTGGSSLKTGASYTTPALTTTTTYYVQTKVAGVSSARTPVTVTVNAPPVAPTANGVNICSGNTATLSASGSSGTYQWYDAATGGSLLGSGSSYTTPYLTTNTSYYVQSTAGAGCTSTRTKVDVTVYPPPSVTSAQTGNACSGNAQNYNITADVPGTTFSWTRAAVAGISNAASSSSLPIIDETLINITTAPIDVTYVIIPSANGCTGVPFNYVVTVYPSTYVTSAPATLVCSGTSPDYDITFSLPGTFFSWSRLPVAGISNPAVSNQISSRIQEILVNTTNAPVNVTYLISYNTPNCPGAVFTLTITVNPQVFINNPPNGTACSGSPLNYTIASNVPTAAYNWSRAAVTEISNAAVTNDTARYITEALINTSSYPVIVNYVITTRANGCQATPFNYAVTVYPAPPVAIANTDAPVCDGSTVNLLTPTIVAGYTYLWTGPNGFTSTDRNPSIANATATNAGTYSLYLVANNCTGTAATVDVVINQAPIVNAGADQLICSIENSITLSGDVHGGTTTGLWTTSGSGVFVPSAKQLNAQYVPSAQDKINGTVTLTLISTSKDNCAVATDELKLKIDAMPAMPVIQSR